MVSMTVTQAVYMYLWRQTLYPDAYLDSGHTIHCSPNLENAKNQNQNFIVELVGQYDSTLCEVSTQKQPNF